MSTRPVSRAERRVTPQGTAQIRWPPMHLRASKDRVELRQGAMQWGFVTGVSF